MNPWLRRRPEARTKRQKNTPAPQLGLSLDSRDFREAWGPSGQKEHKYSQTGLRLAGRQVSIKGTGRI